MNTKRKIILLGVACLFYFCKLFCRRDSHIWVFGAISGKKFEDNSKYLFEFVNKMHSDKVRAIWLAENENVINDVRKEGWEAYTFKSKEGIRVAKKAGVAIFTHSLKDFGNWPRVGGAKLVFLGHGVGFKKTYNAKLSGIGLFLKSGLDKLFSWIQRDITIATSKYNQEQRMNIAGLKNRLQIYITGQPRNDVFKRTINRDKILSKIDVDSSKKIILYMPTYRGLVSGKDPMVDIINDLYNNLSLAKILDKNNYIFVAKLHPMTAHIDIQSRNNFKILDYKNIDSNQELLAEGDILITDFSSCCVDYALLNRPIIFYVPDENWFVKHSEPVCDEFYQISEKNKCYNADELTQCIEKKSLDATNAINELFEDESIKGSCYCENVYKVIINNLS